MADSKEIPHTFATAAPRLSFWSSATYADVRPPTVIHLIVAGFPLGYDPPPARGVNDFHEVLKG